MLIAIAIAEEIQGLQRTVLKFCKFCAYEISLTEKVSQEAEKLLAKVTENSEPRVG